MAKGASPERKPPMFYGFKSTPTWHAWFNRFSAETRIPRAALIDAALKDLARRLEFEQPPARMPDRC